MTRPLPESIPRLLRYCAVGGGTLLVYLALSLLLAEGAGLPPSAAAAISILVASAVNYLGHATITFQGNRPLRRSIGRYLALVAGNAVLAGAVVGALHRLGLNLTLANAVALFLVTAASYVIMARWVMPET